MPKEPRFCPQCGHDGLSPSWPKICPACHHQEHGNPLPVVLAILPVHDAVILVRRGIDPGKGQWALPGGFINRYETPEQAAAREILEESVAQDAEGCPVYPGLVLPPPAFQHFRTQGLPQENLTLHFYWPTDTVMRIAEWCMGLHTIRLPEGAPWNPEVEEIGLFTAQEIQERGLAFQAHQDALECWFAQREHLLRLPLPPPHRVLYRDVFCLFQLHLPDLVLQLKPLVFGMVDHGIEGR